MVNKVDVGGGTLIDFKARYTEFITTKGRKVNASQIYQVITNGNTATPDDDSHQGLYEWVIYYSDEDAINKLFEKDTGKVKIDMTDEDRKEVREESVKSEEKKKPVEVVI